MSKTCCRTCPRCADCPVVLAAAARRRAHDTLVGALVDEIFCGASAAPLPEPVLRTLEALDAARRPGAVLVAA